MSVLATLLTENRFPDVENRYRLSFSNVAMSRMPYLPATSFITMDSYIEVSISVALSWSGWPVANRPGMPPNIMYLENSWSVESVVP